MTFKVGDRVRPINPESSFSHGEVRAVRCLFDSNEYMKVWFDVTPSKQYTTVGDQPTLVMTEWFELEGER